ncbi:Putative ribonuclease H protein At1g65750 [Linum grandiflorum]
MAACSLPFAANLGVCTITRAEMSGVINGTERAWRLGVANLEVQLDSLTAISLFQEQGPCDHQHAVLVLKFRKLVRHNWSVQHHHLYREANQAADFLANLGHFSIHLGTTKIPIQHYYSSLTPSPNFMAPKHG